MNKIATFYIGTGFDANASELRDIESRTELLKSHAATVFGGYSLDKVAGGWNGVSGLVEEPALRLEVLTDATDQSIRRFAAFARKVFNQESVGLAIRHATVEFIDKEAA